MSEASGMTPLRQVRPTSTDDLLDSERRFLSALQQLGFGRFEFVRIHHGELVLNPWPTAVQLLKFGTEAVDPGSRPEVFELKNPMAQLFQYVRSIRDGEIRCLQVLHGQPISMEIEHCHPITSEASI